MFTSVSLYILYMNEAQESNFCSAYQSTHADEAAKQEEKITQLEHDLEEATSNSLEMHKMLSEMLSAQNDTSTFQVCGSLIIRNYCTL